MDFLDIRIILTAAVLGVFLLIKWITSIITDRAAVRFAYSKPRIKIMKKIVTFILFLIGGSMVLFIWGVKQSELFYFISSLLTVLGIAFFAQWSIISNITTTILIYFNHPVKIGDTIQIMDKDNPVEGRISDVGAFFVILKNEKGEKITIPSNVFIQKIVRKIEK